MRYSTYLVVNFIFYYIITYIFLRFDFWWRRTEIESESFLQEFREVINEVDSLWEELKKLNDIEYSNDNEEECQLLKKEYDIIVNKLENLDIEADDLIIEVEKRLKEKVSSK